MLLSRILVGVASIGLLVSVPGGAWTTPMPGLADDLPLSSTCGAELTFGSNDHFVKLCEPATITAQISPQCHRQRVHLFIIRTLESKERRWLPDASIAILDALQSDPRIELAVGHLVFSDIWLHSEYPVTEDLSLIRDALSLMPIHDNNIQFDSRFVKRGLDLLHDARLAAHPSASPPIEILVLFAAIFDEHEPSVRETRIAASLVREYAPDVFLVACSEQESVGAFTRCKPIRDMAFTGPAGGYYARPPDTRKLPRLIQEELEARLAAGPAPASLTVEHRLPAGLTYLDGSASVPLTRLDGPPGAQRLRWDRSGAAAGEAFTVTYQVQPRELGAWTIDTAATVTDTLGLAQTTNSTTGPITVTGPCIEPTDTPPPPSPTPTLPPPTVTPTPTATLAPLVPVFLPVALREPACTPDWQRVDVALVIDASTSMNELTAAGRPKLAAASDAARAFLGALRLDTGDQAAIVTFNAEATLLQTLTSSEPDLHAALDRIATAPQTRIHRGIEVAAAELASPRRAAGHTPVMVLLTDGRANPEGPEFAVAEADTAKRAGVTVFTVGLGDDLDHEALRAMASRPEDYHHAPDAEQLAEIYRAIAVAIPCGPESFWP